MTPSPLREILIADDDSGVRDMLGRAFARDFRVLTASDGAEALRFLEQMKPAAVIVDEMMPHATGTQVLEAAKRRFPGVPRILMTASNDTEKAMAAINHGEIHRFYSKPLKVTEVRRAILDLVERAENEEALRVELQTLRVVKENSQVTRAATRVVIVGLGDETSARGDRVQEAAKSRGFHTVRVTRIEDVPTKLMAAPADVVILLSGPGVDVRALARLAHTIDEATSVIIVDASARIEEAMLALEVGAVDYIADGSVSSDDMLAKRIERAAQNPRASRDMRRLTFDLIVANRELHMARRRVEDEQVKLLNAMIRALEARDEYTAGH
ncbi:MAG TPA: response regulator, partial [Myxococcota bacterium]